MAKGRKTGGRKPGSRNKRTLEIEAIARQILEHPKYQANLKSRANTGTLPPAVETMLFHYLFGKPVEKVEHSGTVEHHVDIEVILE